LESKQPDHTELQVLCGWKEIARYLGKGVRTLQRYEHDLSLPVRRLSRNRGGSVMAAKSDLDNWLKLAPTLRESLNSTKQSLQENLRLQIAQGTREQAQLRTQMTALREELKMSVRRVHESISRLRHQLNETRRRQDSMASAIRGFSKVRDLSSVDGKHRKPN
jgi:hypothetical protein